MAFNYVGPGVGAPCCLLCLRAAQGGYLARGFEVVCLDCVKELLSSVHICKKCGEIFDNQGKLLAHYRNDHAKGQEGVEE